MSTARVARGALEADFDETVRDNALACLVDVVQPGSLLGVGAAPVRARLAARAAVAPTCPQADAAAAATSA